MCATSRMGHCFPHASGVVIANMSLGLFLTHGNTLINFVLI